MYIDNFGYKLKKERKEWGMSKRKLARLCFTDTETIEEIENGIFLNPSFELVLNICETLDLSVFSFIKEDTTITKILNNLY